MSKIEIWVQTNKYYKQTTFNPTKKDVYSSRNFNKKEG